MCSCWPRRRESLLMPDVSLPFGRRVASSKCERAFRFVSAGNAESRRRLFHVLFLDFHRFERHIRRWTWWRAGNPRTELAKCAKQAEKSGKCTGRKITCLFRRGAPASLVANDPLAIRVGNVTGLLPQNRLLFFPRCLMPICALAVPWLGLHRRV